MECRDCGRGDASIGWVDDDLCTDCSEHNERERWESAGFHLIDDRVLDLR